MDVIPHCKLGKVQARSDFLVGETFGNESHQLLLTHRKIRFWRRSFDWALFDYMGNEPEYRGTKFRRADGFPSVDSAHSSNKLGSRCIFQQIAHDSGTNG